MENNKNIKDKNIKKAYTGSKSKWKRPAAFLACAVVFAAVSLPLFVFYGPFINIKRIAVGTFMSTFKHQHIARFFLSDEAIAGILNGCRAVDPTGQGEELKVLDFGTDHTDRIEILDIDGGHFKGKLMIVHDPTRIVAGYSDKMPETGETTSAIARRSGAIAAVNAGGFADQGWTGTGGAPMGFIIHEGKVVYNQLGSETAKQDTVAFTGKGMLIVGKHTILSLKKMGVKEGVSFGPALIVNGRPTIESGDGGWGIAPRTAIGQRENGEVLFLAIDGRSLRSIGATLKETQDLLLGYGAVNAANLDGGSSTTMYFDGRVINNPSDKLGEDAVPSVFMVLPAFAASDGPVRPCVECP